MIEYMGRNMPVWADAGRTGSWKYYAAASEVYDMSPPAADEVRYEML